jgi:serine/threonine protein phosphatase 1
MSAAVERREFALPFAASPDKEIFAIGDIHGRADLLAALIDEAAREPRRREKRAIVFLGDLVDRGPDSLGAIDLAIGAAERIGADEGIALMGNHEAMMRLALDPRRRGTSRSRRSKPGSPTAATGRWPSSSRPTSRPTILTSCWPRRAHRCPRACAPGCESLRASWRSGDLLFVHAGVNPRFDSRRFSPFPGIRRSRARRRTPLGLGAPAIPRPSAGAGGLQRGVCRPRPHPERREARRLARGSDRRFRLNLDAGSGLTGVAKMAIIRGRQAEVVDARGPTNRELMGREER